MSDSGRAAARAERVAKNPRVRARLQETIDRFNDNYEAIETVPIQKFEQVRRSA